MPEQIVHRVLTQQEVLERVKYSRWMLPALYRRGFPTPIRLTGETGRPRWLAASVEEWLLAQAKGE